MLAISTLEEIRSLLLRVPTLVHAYDEQALSFLEDLKQWLLSVEQVLASAHLAAAAEVASIRSTLIATERGLIPPDLHTAKKLTSRKMKAMAGAELLRRAERAVAMAVNKDFAQMEEAERIVQQITTLMGRRNLLPPADSTGLASLWQQISADEMMAMPAARVESLIGVQDALLLLRRALQERLTAAPITNQ